jgi:hypothetical protein
LIYLEGRKNNASVRAGTNPALKSFARVHRGEFSTGKSATGAEVKKKVSEETANESLG